MPAAGWLRVQLGQPGVLLLLRLGPQRAEGVAVAMFGLSLVWVCSSAEMSACTRSGRNRLSAAPGCEIIRG
jgi:hypothetical protein